MLLGLLSFAVNIIGVILFYTNLSTSTIIFFIVIGGSLGILENLIGIMSGEQKSTITIIIAVAISFIVFKNTLPWWQVILIGSMFESAIMGLFSIPMYILIIREMKS